jgi:hypothetical protein
VAILVAVVAALFDRSSGRIPNLLTVSALVVGLARGGWCSLAAALVCTGWVLQLEGMSIGGGDAKLLAAIAALNPVVGLGLALSIPRLAARRISMRAAPSLAIWVAIFSCCLELR